MVNAWAIRSMAEGDQWDDELIRDMQGTPQRPNPNKAGSSIPITISFDQTPNREVEGEVRPARREDKPRGMYIKPWMLEKCSKYGLYRGL